MACPWSLLMLVLGVSQVSGITDLVYSCYTNGTIIVQHPLSYTHTFAVQDEGSSAAVKCTVDTSGSTSFITGCQQGERIVAFFSNRSGLVDTFGSNTFISYEIACGHIPDEGVFRTVGNALGVTIEATSVDAVTPSFVISSALRQPDQLGAPVYVAAVGDEVHWTIDIPADYTALPTCTAYSGIDNTGEPNKLLVLDGCLQDSDLLGGHFSGIDTSIPDIKRYYTILYVFKFYNSENVYFQCSVKLCPAGSLACDLNCSRRRRSIGFDNHTMELEEIFTTGDLILVLPQDSSAASRPGDHWILSAMVMMVVYIRC